MDHKKHTKKVDELADKMLAPEAEQVIIHHTARDIAAEIDLYSDLVPEEKISQAVSGAEESTVYENQDAYDVFEGVVGEEILNPPPVKIDEAERITYSSSDKKRLLRELGVGEPDETPHHNPNEPRRTIIQKSEKRIEPAELAAREAEKLQAEIDKHTEKKEPRKRRAPSNEEIKARKNTVILAGIVLAILYIFCFVYVAAVNREDSEAAARKLRTLNSTQILTKISKTDTTVSVTDKDKYKLSVYKLDSDDDGLTDFYELQYSATGPAVADTDGDGIPDGTELRAGTNPKEAMSDGHTPDADRNFTFTAAIDAMSFAANGRYDIYNTTIDRYPLNTQNIPGLLTPAYEVSFPSSDITGTLVVDLSGINLQKWGEESSVGIYRYNPDDGSMIPAAVSDSNNSGDGGDSGDSLSISAAVTSGIYFAADKNYMSAEVGTNIMFVIDNSGSMYPQSVVGGSEENDLEFKRVSFAEDIIAEVGDEVNFGVGKFTLQYNTLAPITTDDNTALAALNSLRTGAEDFDGTEISSSIIAAINEFENLKFDRNYIIVITDGLPTHLNKDNEQLAINLAKEKNISVITIGLGKKIDADFLSVIAEETGGVYYQAVNNATFDTISAKIAELLYSGRTAEIEQTDLIETGGGYEKGSVGTIKVLVLADSGFVVEEDALNFKDIPTVYDREGSDLGLAVFNKLYYSGALPLTADGYVTNSNVQVGGYDLSNSTFYTAGKQNLADLVLPKSESYYAYKTTVDRWDFSHIRSGVLPLSKMALTALSPIDGFYRIEKGRYDWSGGERRIPGFMRAITFQRQDMFSDYEYAAIDIDAMAADTASDEYQTLRAVTYYNSYDDKGGVVWLSFGIDGKSAFTELENQLTLGIPAVIAANGKTYNAARLTRSPDDPGLFIIEAYSPSDIYGMSTLIYLSATPLFENTAEYQYTVTIADEPANLYILKD